MTETRPRSAAACADTFSPKALLLDFEAGGETLEAAAGIGGAIVIDSLGVDGCGASVDAVVAGVAFADALVPVEIAVAVCGMTSRRAPCAPATRLENEPTVAATGGNAALTGCAIRGSPLAEPTGAPLLDAVTFAVTEGAACAGSAIVFAADAVTTMAESGGVAVTTGAIVVGTIVPGAAGAAAADCAPLSLSLLSPVGAPSLSPTMTDA